MCQSSVHFRLSPADVRSAAKLGFTFMLLLIHTHGDDDTWSLPEWFVVPRQGSGADGRGGYGAINNDD